MVAHLEQFLNSYDEITIIILSRVVMAFGSQSLWRISTQNSPSFGPKKRLVTFQKGPKRRNSYSVLTGGLKIWLVTRGKKSGPNAVWP